jgi:hypothetical protein
MRKKGKTWRESKIEWKERRKKMMGEEENKRKGLEKNVKIWIKLRKGTSRKKEAEEEGEANNKIECTLLFLRSSESGD